VLCLSAPLVHAEAQFGDIGGKVLRKGNIDAAEKLVRSAALTDAQIEKLTAESIAYMDSQNRVAPDGDPYAERLKRLVKGHETEDGLQLNFKVYLVRDVNAFAAPDGSIRVMAGLMQLMTDDELRSIIGHEIGHVKLKHIKKQYQKAYAVSASRDAAQANTGQASVLAEGELGKFTEEVLNAKFSRTDESNADEYGFKFMLKHGYEYHAMEVAFLKLAGDGTTKTLWDTHPDPDERAKHAEQWAATEDSKRQAAAPAPAAVPASATAADEADEAEKDTEPKAEPSPEPAQDAPAGDSTED
jgi:putative metalloprotease